MNRLPALSASDLESKISSHAHIADNLLPLSGCVLFSLLGLCFLCIVCGLLS